ncbi:MAG TPA: tetratricopeptide repeat protein [Opitutaceae bacterium]|jgi:tetratricopeptide (TPR) repeat protein
MKRAGANRRWLAIAILTIAVAAAYATALGGGFVYLDGPAIRQNDTLRHGFDWKAILNPPTAGGVTVGGRPLVNVTLALNYALGGLNPWGYHLFNGLIHLLAAWVLFDLVRRVLARREGDTGRAELTALMVSAVWAVHPLTTEAVTYVVQRAESLMGLCYLLTLYTFVRWIQAERPVIGWAVLSVVACGLGMTAKEVMVSAPVIVVLFDRAFVATSFREAGRRRWGYYAALALTWIPLAALVAQGGGNRGGTAGFDLGFSWWGYLRTQFPAILHYLRMAVWPHPLNFYSTPTWEFSNLRVAGSGVIVVALAVTAMFGALRGRAWGFLGTAFFAVLAPTSLVPGMSQTMAEHRMYLALVPVVVFLVLILRRAACAVAGGLSQGGACGPHALFGIESRTAGVTAPGYSANLVFVIVGAIWVVALGVATSRRNLDYKDELTLWTDTARRSPDNAFVLNNLGVALAAANRPGEAIAPLTEAARIRPSYAEAEDNLGLALAEAGRPAEALPHYERALVLRPHDLEAEANLGVACVALNRPDEAVTYFRRALADDPRNHAARANLAAALARRGRWDEAAKEFRQALEGEPANAEMHYDFANVLAAQAQWADAADQYRRAVQLGLGSSDAEANLGAALANLGQWPEAIASYRSALAQAPSDPDIHYNLGLALRASGHRSDADSEFAAAERLRRSQNQR